MREIQSLRPSTSLTTALGLLLESGASSLPVIDEVIMIIIIISIIIIIIIVTINNNDNTNDNKIGNKYKDNVILNKPASSLS